MANERRDQHLFADITREATPSGLNQKLLDQLHRVRKVVRELQLDDCTFELHKRTLDDGDGGDPLEHIFFFIRRNPAIDADEPQESERPDGGRPPISLHDIDLELRTLVLKGDVDVVTPEQMLIVREALQRLVEVPKGRI